MEDSERLGERRPKIHQQVQTPVADIWKLYFAENIQAASYSWYSWRFLDLLFSEGTESFKIIPPPHSNDGGIIDVELTGKCHDGPATIRYKLRGKELSDKEKSNFLALVKVTYNMKKDRYQYTVKGVARCLGIS